MGQSYPIVPFEDRDRAIRTAILAAGSPFFYSSVEESESKEEFDIIYQQVPGAIVVIGSKSTVASSHSATDVQVAAWQSPTTTQNLTLFSGLTYDLLQPLILGGALASSISEGTSSALTTTGLSEGITSLLVTAGLLPRSGAFEQLATLRADESGFLRVVKELRTREEIAEREVLAARLENLLQAYREDYGESLNDESARTLVTLMAKNKDLALPRITATPTGNLFGEWRERKGPRYVGVQFLPTRILRYVAKRADPKHPQTRIRASGSVTVDQFVTEIASYGLSKWGRRAK